MFLSFWEKDFLQEKFDVTILGAGITGVSTAISIKEKNPSLKVCILERAGVSLGASTKNAGFACFGSPTEILEDIKNVGEKKTSEILKMRWDGLQKLKSRIPAGNMKFDPCGGYEIFRKGDHDFKEVKQKMSWLNEYVSDVLKIKEPYVIHKNNELPGFEQDYVFNPYEGSLHPGHMMFYLHKLAREAGVIFHVNCNVEKIDFETKHILLENEVVLPYQILCICTNGFSRKLIPALEVFPARNQVLITKPIKKIPFTGCFHFAKGYYYFRNVGDRILLGGARNIDAETEMTDHFGLSTIIQDELIRFLEMIAPGTEEMIDQWWSGILGIGKEKKPIVEWVDTDVICGVRLGGMGVAIGSHLGDLLAQSICTKLGYTE